MEKNLIPPEHLQIQKDMNALKLIKIKPSERLKQPVTFFKGAINTKPVDKGTLTDLFKWIKDEGNQYFVDLAEDLKRLKKEKPSEYKRVRNEKAFGFIPGTFSKRSKAGLQEYLPLIVIDIDNCDPDGWGESHIEETINRLKELNYVWAAFPSPSYQGVRALVWAESSKEIHEKVYFQVCKDISSKLNIPLKSDGKDSAKVEHIDDGSTKSISTFWFFTHVPKDELIYFNEKSSTFKPQIETFENHENQKEKGTCRKSISPSQRTITEDDRVKAAWNKFHVGSKSKVSGRNDAGYQIACNLVEFGVTSSPRIEVEMTKMRDLYPNEKEEYDDDEIRKSRKSAQGKTYQKYSDKEIFNFLDIGQNGRQYNKPKNEKQEEKKKPQSENQSIEDNDYDEESNYVKKIENALLNRYNFRVNAIKGIPEYKKKSASKWAPINDYVLNSLVRDLQSKYIKKASKDMISTLLNSSFAPKIDPIVEYFKALKWDNLDHIKKLCETVEPKGDDLKESKRMFRKYLTKWLVAAIANVFDKKICRNHQCFILAGPQGAGKSTWIKKLCPQALEPYYVEQGLDPDNKDSQLDTTTNFIFNLDDYFAATTSKKINEFKGIITKNVVKVRMPYGRYPEERPKICSSNEAQFLHDPTGNRRFVPFEVTEIYLDKFHDLNIDQVWAQAYEFYRTGFQYWLNKDDQAELNEHNAQFEVRSPEYEYLEYYFKVPEGQEGEEVEYYQTGRLATKLKEFSNMNMSVKKVGEAARKLGFERKSFRENGKILKGYAVVRILHGLEKSDNSEF